VSLWICPNHGLYGGSAQCPKCGSVGEWWDGTFEKVETMDKNLLRQRIDFIRRGSEVQRFHTMRTIQRNDVGHHSFHVAWLAWLMSPRDAHGVVMAALTHDLAEHRTGDLPGDFKKDMGLSDDFAAYENKLMAGVGLEQLGECLLPEEARILKLADLMEGCFFCISERSLGNDRLGHVFANYRRYIGNMRPFHETEEIILDYIDEQWLRYGGQPIPMEEAMPDESLTAVLRTEEAEGRATAGPQSNAPIQGDASLPEQPVEEPTDDRATSDIVPERHSSPANARQYGGDHYKGVGYEHWDLVLDTGMNYFQGCATKYVTRWRKHEAGETNLLKAIHYVDKLEEAQAAGRIKPEGVHTVSDIVNFGVANALNDLEVQIIKDIVGWRLGKAREHLERLRAGYTELEQTNERAYYSQND
jgi:5'-deoxynucleotidase YfbR-like HD superfamily hydrolase